MQRRRRIIEPVLLIGLLLAGCDLAPATVDEYQAWLGNPQEGPCRVKQNGDVQITMKYLPPELLSHKEMAGQGGKPSQAVYDSVRASYANSLTFLMTISPANTGPLSRDVMSEGIGSFQEFTERVRLLSFDLGDCISLVRGNEEIRPALTHFENSYGLMKERDIILVFPKISPDEDDGDMKALDVRFVDKIFNTGIHHFEFNPAEIREASERFPTDL